MVNVITIITWGSTVHSMTDIRGFAPEPEEGTVYEGTIVWCRQGPHRVQRESGQRAGLEGPWLSSRVVWTSRRIVSALARPLKKPRFHLIDPNRIADHIMLTYQLARATWAALHQTTIALHQRVGLKALISSYVTMLKIHSMQKP